MLRSYAIPAKEHMSQTIRTIPVTEVAKLVRTHLREQFGKQQKFSVRSRSTIHPSITITWHDGPSVIAVRAATRIFVGAENDLDSWTYHPTTWQETLVQFDCTYISCQRTSKRDRR